MTQVVPPPPPPPVAESGTVARRNGEVQMAAGLEDLRLEQIFWISGWISDLVLIQFYSAVLKYGFFILQAKTAFFETLSGNDVSLTKIAECHGFCSADAISKS